MHSRLMALTASAVVVALSLAGCASDTGAKPQKDDSKLTIWTIEDKPDRLQAQEKMLDAFSASNDVDYELVPIAEDQLSSALTAAAAANELPDLVSALPLSNVHQFANDDLLDTEAAAEVVKKLDAGTFNKAALDLTRSGDTQLAVPSDAFPLMLFYRTDLFKAAGLDAPTDYPSVLEAAKKLNGNGVAGISAATSAAEQFTSQTIESFGLSNDCQLVNGKGDLALDSDNCKTAFGLYTDLMSKYSVAGEQDTATTRASYFAGQAAMVVWSSFLLDELAGLRNDALPTCDQCAADPRWLANNTGVVGGLQGPDASSPATYGEVVSFAIMRDAAPITKDLVSWLMSDSYTDWISVAPEGKIPVRTGAEPGSTEYVDGWADLETGVDTREKLSALYSPEVLDTVVGATNDIVRWGMTEGQGGLAGAMTTQRVLPTLFSDLIASGGSLDDALVSATDKAEQIKSGLGG
ncbi:bicyclomycin resistance protein [Microbacterium nanhaiense]|uniref:Bicyclomycin resistance protein n=1 Tax=Microbacterium nanhaiense TaxID=1301026 RepID=A0ABQ2N494_9MICO|nr:extracellular solute-binding protein [Microbacterium nanhaiense]GGO67630.1 bicyclomycin resistance protein [Microbacterium nanhaiense]